MKQVIFLLPLMSFFSIGIFAQKKFDVEAFRAEQEKIITHEAGLTPEEAKAFFPLYHEMNRKRFELVREERNQIKTITAGNNITADQYLKMVDTRLEVHSKEVEIEKEYYTKFKKILPPEKLFKVSVAEMKMNREMLKNRDDRANNKSRDDRGGNKSRDNRGSNKN